MEGKEEKEEKKSNFQKHRVKLVLKKLRILSFLASAKLNIVVSRYQISSLGYNNILIGKRHSSFKRNYAKNSHLIYVSTLQRYMKCYVKYDFFCQISYVFKKVKCLRHVSSTQRFTLLLMSLQWSLVISIYQDRIFKE